jgi:hypothetical protein
MEARCAPRDKPTVGVAWTSRHNIACHTICSWKCLTLKPKYRVPNSSANHSASASGTRDELTSPRRRPTSPPRHDPRTRPAIDGNVDRSIPAAPRLNTTQSSRTMRDDRIQNTRHLRQHVIPRSKTGQTTCYLSGQITCSRQDTQYR